MANGLNPVAQNFPNVGGPFCDPDTGRLTDVAQNFLQTLFVRTGGVTGIDGASVSLLANEALLKGNSLSDVTSAQRARQNLGLTAAATAEPASGWSEPTGTVSRAALNAGFSGTASATYTQAQVQALYDQLQMVSQILGALIEDSISYGVISA